MSKLSAFLGMTIGGWIGWAIGARLSFVAAFFLSVIATAIGLYVGRRIAQAYF